MDKINHTFWHNVVMVFSNSVGLHTRMWDMSQKDWVRGEK